MLCFFDLDVIVDSMGGDPESGKEYYVQDNHKRGNRLFQEQSQAAQTMCQHNGVCNTESG
jgi:hypothetical protein